MSLVMDSKNWRGRAQLYGVKTQDRVVYIKGPRVGAWVWDSAKHPTLQKLEATVYQASLAASDTFQAKKQELEASGRYTVAGIRDELKRFADAAITPTLDKAKAELAEARRAVADRHSRIKPVAAESSNDSVSTMRKIEARTVLRTMPRQESSGFSPAPTPIRFSWKRSLRRSHSWSTTLVVPFAPNSSATPCNATTAPKLRSSM